ncbi:hypothetical protein P280DRAFT_399050, partial [Massarina eburnea CBS 473.64]
GEIYEDQEFRLDMQGESFEKPKRRNLQVQVNYSTRISTLENVAPDTIAGPVLVPLDKPW